MRENVVADGDDPVNHDASLFMLLRDLAEILTQRDRSVCNQRVVLDIVPTKKLRRRLFRLLSLLPTPPLSSVSTMTTMSFS
jgi:hypothetical protein